MSTFYGTLKGCRGEATMCGSKQSGIRASAQSWEGSVITELGFYNDQMNIYIYISDNSSSSSYGAIKYFDGTFEELKECFDMYNKLNKNDLKNRRNQK